MKKFALSLLIVAGLISCNKEEDEPNTTPPPEPYKCATCTANPEAKAEYDGSSAGVYKGVLVGSSGTIALYLYNSGNEVKALVSFDGQNATLTCQSLSSWTPGQPINGAVFTGTFNGQAITATFSVGANGQNPQVQVNIPGHTVTVAVYKETSTALVKNYEGSYTGDDNGTFNMTLHGSEYSIVISNGGIMVDDLVNGAIDHLTNDNVAVKGSFSGDNVSGTWDDNKGKKGTWAGKRTL